MTHSLHREGSVESLERDYCMLIYPARGWNSEGVTPKLQHLLELVFLENPSNLLVKMIERLARQTPTAVETTRTEVSICYEVQKLSLPTVGLSLIHDRPDCPEIAARIHTRKDVNWAPLIGSSPGGQVD